MFEINCKTEKKAIQRLKNSALYLRVVIIVYQLFCSYTLQEHPEIVTNATLSIFEHISSTMVINWKIRFFKCLKEVRKSLAKIINESNIS